MADAEGIPDDELLYRRIPKSQGWYDPATNSLSSQAFRPTKFDDDGLSLTRSEGGVRSPEDAAAQGREGAEFFVAVIKAGDLAQLGLKAERDDQPGRPGHALIRDIRYANRREPNTETRTLKMATQLGVQVRGPFPGRTPRDP